MRGIQLILPDNNSNPLGNSQGQSQTFKPFTKWPDLMGSSSFENRFTGAEYATIQLHLGATRRWEDESVHPDDSHPRSFQFDISVPAGVAGGNARWCQWARYTRAWGVDPGYPSIDTFFGDNSINPTPGDMPLTTSVVRGPINHMNRRAPRYIIGKGQVTRSKGRPLYVTGGLVEEHVPKKPSEVNLEGSPYNAMEQVPGEVKDKAIGQPVETWATIHLLNQDTRDGNLDDPRYMWDVDAELAPGLAPTKGAHDFAVSWGNVYKSSDSPDGTLIEEIGENGEFERHWLTSPWFTRNYRLAASWTYAPPGQAEAYYYLYGNRKPTFFSMNTDSWQGGFGGPMGDGYVDRFPDKGYYGYDGIAGKQELAPYGLQMLQKDAPFEQVGEVLNVWLWGHEILMPAANPNAVGLNGVVTTQTFSEAMLGLTFLNDPTFKNNPLSSDNVDDGIVFRFTGGPIQGRTWRLQSIFGEPVSRGSSSSQSSPVGSGPIRSDCTGGPGRPRTQSQCCKSLRREWRR